MPFLEGQSGNPKGRNKSVRFVQELARKQTEASIETLVEIMQDDEQRGTARVAAAEALLNRAWGRPEQAVQISGQLESIVVNVVKKEQPG